MEPPGLYTIGACLFNALLTHWFTQTISFLTLFKIRSPNSMHTGTLKKMASWHTVAGN